MFQTTRRRLALWYTAVTAVLLLLIATGVYLYVRTTLIDRMDDTLKHVVEVVERSLVIQPLEEDNHTYRVNIPASFRDNAQAVEDDHIDLEWFSADGNLLWSTLTEPFAIPLATSPTDKTVHLDSDNWLRQVTQPIKINAQLLGYLRVSHPWFEVTKPIQQLIWDLTVGTTIMLICTAAIGWLLSGLAMKPVRESYHSLKQFTADASHELRNPIAMIQTNVQVALTYGDGETQLQRRQLQVIERLTQRVGRLVDDLLFLTRSDSGIVQSNYQELPLDALLIGVIEEQRAIAQQKNIYLSLHIVEPTAQYKITIPIEEYFTVTGDWDYLARLFTNLISNALEHADFEPVSLPKEASVEVELQLIGKPHNPNLEVKVKDTGKGIPPEVLPYIFDRFYRVQPSHGSSENAHSSGAGLGLAIAKAIIDHHQGKITVESVMNQGTTFRVVLPKLLPFQKNDGEVGNIDLLPRL